MLSGDREAFIDNARGDIELQPLSSINNIFERLQHGHVASGVVVDFDMR